MGDFGANGAEIRGSVCGFPTAGHKKHSKRLRYGLWRHMTSKAVLQGAGGHLIQTYVKKMQATVAEWVDLQPIFGIFENRYGL